jgi:23S rRNA pseudouridine955/2504/2580 synthase
VTKVTIVSVKQDEAGQRLDRWFHRRYPMLGHGGLEKMLRKGQIRVDGARAKAALRLDAGAEVRVPPMPAEGPAEKPRARAISRDEIEQVKALVLYKDDEIIAINKPSGLAVQGGTGTTRHLDAMLDGLKFDKPERPRLVHRLDKDTSGVLLLARNAKSAASLTAAFRGRDVAKIYWALVVGIPHPRQGRIDQPLLKQAGKGGERVRISEMGQSAITDFQIVDQAGQRTAWVALKPLTGRTHQLRVHMAGIGHPIVGDGKYGGPEAFLGGDVSGKMHLHARSIEIEGSDGRKRVISAPLTGQMRETWTLFGFEESAARDLEWP